MIGCHFTPDLLKGASESESSVAVVLRELFERAQVELREDEDKKLEEPAKTVESEIWHADVCQDARLALRKQRKDCPREPPVGLGMRPPMRSRRMARLLSTLIEVGWKKGVSEPLMEATSCLMIWVGRTGGWARLSVRLVAHAWPRPPPP